MQPPGQRQLRSDQIVVEGLGQPKYGANSFLVRLLKVHSVEKLVPTVTIESTNGERLNNAVVKENGHHEWTATYNIPRDGRYKISVSVDGVEAKGSPFDRVWQEKLSKGMKVRRGQDWKWEDQDGGRGKIGVVQGDYCLRSWVVVKWESSQNTNQYRWGAQDAFDLEIVP